MVSTLSSQSDRCDPFNRSIERSVYCILVLESVMHTKVREKIGTCIGTVKNHPQ